MSAGAAFRFKYLNVWDPFLGAQRASGEAAPFDLLEGDAPSAPIFYGGAAIVWNRARIRSGFQLMHNVPETALSAPEARAPTEHRPPKLGDQSDP
jgi:hypothetical protein